MHSRVMPYSYCDIKQWGQHIPKIRPSNWVKAWWQVQLEGGTAQPRLHDAAALHKVTPVHHGVYLDAGFFVLFFSNELVLIHFTVRSSGRLKGKEHLEQARSTSHTGTPVMVGLLDSAFSIHW